MQLLPGSTIGMLGGGQLGRMFGFAAKRLGYKVITLDPNPNCPMGQVVDDQIVAAFDDVVAAKQLAERCDVVTYEFENVSTQIADAISAIKPLYPDVKLLYTSQNRLREKTFFRDNNIPVTEFLPVRNQADLDTAIQQIGFPAVLKTCELGYDGKGQKIVKNVGDVRSACPPELLQRRRVEIVQKELGSNELIWEKLVEFTKEVSVICTRGKNGEVVTYPVSENIHSHNILDITIVPARISDATTVHAKDIAKKVATTLNVVGTFCVELFVLADGSVIANEIAPRPHNSGHYSIEACYTSQFENQVRAVCGLPLGDTSLRCGAAVMLNILGEGTGNTLAGVEEIMQQPNAYLHLYGKAEAKRDRKMGHVTLVGDEVEALLQQVETVRKTLRWIQ